MHRRPVARAVLLRMLLWTAAVVQPQAHGARPGEDLLEQAGPPEALAVAETTLGILSFARWPGDPEEIDLCVIGPAEHAQVLLQAGRAGPATGHRVSIHALAPEQPAIGCEALYLGRLSQARLQAVLRQAAGQAVLTIGESREACVAGGMFCLDVRDAHAGFEVNLDSLARSGVRVQPRVLQLGRQRRQKDATP